MAKEGMTRTGHCAYESQGSHEYCQEQGYNCDCPCHKEKK